MQEYFNSRRDILIPAGIFLLLILFYAAMLPAAPLWITDNGAKWMIMENFRTNGTIFFNHPVTENFPFCGFHFMETANGDISSFHSPYLPVLAAWCKNFAGNAGILLIPMISMAGIAAILCKFQIASKKSVALAAAASPMFFYSLLLWEMIPAAFAVTLAAYCLTCKRSFTAGFVFACGIWMREELYLLAIAFAAAMIIKKQFRELIRFAAGAIIPTIALWITNYALFENILGLHGSKYFVNNRMETGASAKFKEIIFNFYQHLIRFETLPGYSGIMAFAALICAAAAGTAGKTFRSLLKFKTAAFRIFTVITAVMTFALLRCDQYLMISAKTFGLFISFPVSVLLLLNCRPLICCRNIYISIAAITFFLYSLLIVFFLNPNDIGLTWGARHFIILMPLIAVLAVFAANKSGFTAMKRKMLLPLLCIVGIIMQIYALNALVKVADDSDALQNTILELPQKTVISDLFFLPEMTPGVFFEKTQLEITGKEQLDSAIKFLEQNRISSFILLLSPDYRRIPNNALAELLQKYPVKAKPELMTIGNSLKIYIALCGKK